jgi:hypothetical protein
VTVSRALDLVIGTSAPRMLVHDLVMMAAVNLVCAAFLFRWIAWTSLVMLAAAVFAALVPADAFRIFSLGTGVALIVIVGFAWKGGK